MNGKSRDMFIALFLGSILFCIICLFFLILAGAFKGEYYKYRDYGGETYSIKYPKEWKIKVGENDDVLESTIFGIPAFQENEPSFGVSVTVIEVTSELKDKPLPDVAKSMRVPFMERGKNLRVIKEDESTLAGKTGYKVVFIVEIDKKMLKVRQFMVVHNQKIFSVDYEILEKDYGEYIDQADKMVKSFEIKD